MRRLRPRHGVRNAAVAVLLVVPLLFVSLGNAVSVRAGDPLTEAISAQKALQQKIAAQRKQITQLQAEQSSLSALLTATARQLDQINANQAEVQQQVAQASAALDKVRAQYVALVADVNHLDWQLTQLDGEIQDGEAQLAQTKGVLAQHLADAYMTQQTGLLDQLLSSHSFADVLANVAYYLSYGAQDAQIAQQIEQQQADLQQLQQQTLVTRAQTQQTRLAVNAQKATMTQQRDALIATQEKLARLEAQTKALQAARAAAFSKVAKTKAQAARVLADQEASLQALKKRIDELVAQQRNIPSVYNGTFIWPMPGVVTQEFGCTGFIAEPPLGNCAHFHIGIDIAAPMYTPIRAAGDGTVIFVGPNPYDPPYARAWIVIIAHSQSLLTWYAHIDNAVHPPVVVRGEVVQQGQVIAYEGDTGNSTGPHLHWGVELNGQFVNPRLFL